MALARTPQDRQHDNPRSIISNRYLKSDKAIYSGLGLGGD